MLPMGQVGRKGPRRPPVPSLQDAALPGEGSSVLSSLTCCGGLAQGSYCPSKNSQPH